MVHPGWPRCLPIKAISLSESPLELDPAVLTQKIVDEQATVVIMVDTRTRDATAMITSAIAVARALAQTEQSVRLLHVTPPGTDNKPLPAALAVEALLRSLIAETPKVSAGTLSLPLPDGVEAARFILAETAALAPTTIRHVLYKNGKRLHTDIAPLIPVESGQGFRRHGTYLLVGGLGEVGQRLAAQLIQRYQARIAIVGRTPLDDERRRQLAELGPS